MAAKVRVGDYGTVFRATIVDEDGNVVPLSGATTLEIVFGKPDGATVAKTASLDGDGSDGKIKYVAQAGDIDIAGWWLMQGRVVTGSGGWRSTIHAFEVAGNL